MTELQKLGREVKAMSDAVINKEANLQSKINEKAAELETMMDAKIAKLPVGGGLAMKP